MNYKLLFQLALLSYRGEITFNDATFHQNSGTDL